jgi:hypothetical protein
MATIVAKGENEDPHLQSLRQIASMNIFANRAPM